ncbi:RNA polymerase sigma factor [Chitinophaga lutea]
MNYDLLPDSELIHRLKSGEEQAFDAIYRRYWRMVFQTAWKRVKDEELAKDIVQDIFIYCWNKRASLEVETLEAWFRTAAKYQVFKRIKRQKAGEFITSLLYNQELSFDRPDDLIRSKEFNTMLGALIENLPSKRREIFRLRYEEGLSTDAIANKLDVSRKTVQNQLANAEQSIKASLAQLMILLLIFS